MKDLDASLRRRIESAETDYLLSRTEARWPSMVVDQHIARLLFTFSQPRTLVDAVLLYCEHASLEVHAALEDAYPALSRMISAGVLVGAEEPLSQTATYTFSVGELWNGKEIMELIQAYEDTEVYRVRDGDTLLALKIARPTAGSACLTSLANEAEALKKLNGRFSPMLREQNVYKGQAHLTTEWCTGPDVGLFADRCRAANTPHEDRALRQACCGILEAYAFLHSLSILHGDIHTRNIIVSGDRVTLLDFGLAQVWPNGPKQSGARRGVSFYFEPEYALARAQNGREPERTPAGEQYSLAVLLFRLLTGQHYLDLNLDETQLLQIAFDSPRSFGTCGVSSWPAGEAVLRTALAKDPNQRFESVEDFAGSLRAASLEQDAGLPLLRKTTHLRDFVDRVIHTLSPKLLTTASPSPICSVYFGWAGIAHATCRLSVLRNDPHLLAQADVFAETALRYSAEPHAFWSPSFEPSEAVPGPGSLYHGLSGAICVRALVSLAQCDLLMASEAITRFCTLASEPNSNYDATLGHASLLLGASALFEALEEEHSAQRSHLLALGKSIKQKLSEILKIPQAMTDYGPIPWLGVAHGWAGILYACLRWEQATQQHSLAAAGRRLDELAGLSQPSGGIGVCWPRYSYRRKPEPMPAAGWCHGTAGYVHLWTLAHQLSNEQRFRDLAERAACHTWEVTRRTGGGLCCGMAGQACALSVLARHTQSKKWSERARVLAELAIKQQSDRQLSLFHGELGVALMAAQLDCGDSPLMPLFNSEIPART